MKTIPLSIRKTKNRQINAPRFAIVDDRDYALVIQHKWRPVRIGKNWYARTDIKTSQGERLTVRMHRLILGFPPSLIDHRNLNGLDNRRRNLRLATKSQNAANSSGHRDRKSKHKGVCLETFSGLWLAQLTVAGKMVFKARFKTEAQAARAYSAAIKLHCGKFARRA